MRLRWPVLVAFLLVAVAGSLSAQKASEPAGSSPPDVRLAQLKVAMAQAELEKVRQQLRQPYLDAQQTLEAIERKRKLLFNRRRLLADKDAKDAKATQELERELEQLELAEGVAKAALDRAAVAFWQSRQSEGDEPAGMRAKKTMPLPDQLKRIREELATEVDVDFTDIEGREFHSKTLLNIVAKRYKLRTIFAGTPEAKLRPFDGARTTLAGLLQLIDDNLIDHVLVVRDYGICVMSSEKLPEDVLTYRAFRRDYLTLPVK